jgi:tetratricopeptide (TPR) repeat protein
LAVSATAPGHLQIERLVIAGDEARKHGKAAEAVTLYEQALRLSPQHLEARNNLGNALMQLGLYEEAVRSYLAALLLDPDNAVIYFNLANAYRLTGNFEQAVINNTRALALDPAFYVAHNNMGLIHTAAGRLAEAAASYRRALALNDRDADVLSNLATVLRDLGELPEAVELYQRAVELEPRRADRHCSLGHALLELPRLHEAAASYLRALELKPDLAIALVSLGTVQRQLGHTIEAEASCQAALAIDAKLPEALELCGELLTDRGRFEEAERFFRRAIALDPRFPFAYYSIVTNRRMNLDDEWWLRGVEELLRGPLPLRHQISLQYALGKYFDDTKDFERAFGHYRQANDLTRRYGMHFEKAALVERVDRIIGTFDAVSIARLQSEGNLSERPVFIIGMPRSGTTLAEQILASHPAVFGAGELVYWQVAIGMFEAGKVGSQAGGTSIAGLAREYLQRLKALSADALRVVDKMPANFMSIGLIRAAFPRARFIHLQRHPLDTCLSIYFQHFSQAHPYAHDLGDLAAYYEQYVRLMAHWRQVLPPSALLEISYEDLIEQQEPTSRRLVEFLGLPWDPKCLDFHNTERSVITLSKWQVRQKIHKASAGRWKHYERFLKPLQGLVGPTPLQ